MKPMRTVDDWVDLTIAATVVAMGIWLFIFILRDIFGVLIV